MILHSRPPAYPLNENFETTEKFPFFRNNASEQYQINIDIVPNIVSAFIPKSIYSPSLVLILRIW